MRHCATLAVGALAAACGGRTPASLPEVSDGGGGAAPIVEPPALITTSSKLDVLFVLDNSTTGGHGARVLAATVPYFLDRLQNPRCVNGLGQIVDTPSSGGVPCQVGKRDFAPLRDIHLGVVTTSLGGHGADACSPATPSYHPENDDGARLIDRQPGGGAVATHRGLGYLAWDPDGQKTPPGDASPAPFVEKLQAIVEGAGERGCGYEAPLEAAYRFLVAPDPYASIDVVNDTAVLQGTDEVLLEQRAAFLRPDSAVLVIVLTDEDDCSTRDGGQFFFSNQVQDEGGAVYHLPRPRAACADDPNDPCCTSCGQPLPSGCADLGECDGTTLSDTEDPINLRCWDQKRRFGIDFLQPLDRYVGAFSDPTVADRDGALRPNPLVNGVRDPRILQFAAIVGVPWQDLALKPSNLALGLVQTSDIPWSLLLPGPDGAPPEDPLMEATPLPRRGTHPITGEALAPPSSGPTANAINGHEHSHETELQYACTFPVLQEIACTQGACPCNDALPADDPTCQEDDGSYGSVQRRGRALPTPRILSLVQALGAQGTLGTACVDTLQTGNPAYGLRPSVDAIMRDLGRRLTPAD